MRRLIILLAAALSLASCSDDFRQWAQTPPMGWNSWDCYGPTVREDEVKANADYLAENLKQYGWEYVVVDIRWYISNDKAGGYNQTDAIYNMDGYGRYQPAPNRFPSSADGSGFKELADYIHSKGLKFGIHLMRGIPRIAVEQKTPVKGTDGITADMICSKDTLCTWLNDNYTVDASKPGAQEYYNSLFEMFAEWGLDFIKIDDLSRPYHKKEIELIRNAIDNCGRPIVLSLSPGRTPVEEAEHVRTHANMWRMVDDVWDVWEDIPQLMDVAQGWYDYIAPGTWPDCDMIPLGHISIRGERGEDRMTRLTVDEQYTLMTFFTIFRSPLMFGGDLPTMDDFTLSLLTNKEVLKMHRESSDVRQIFQKDNQVAVTSVNRKTGERYLALFNIDDENTQDIKVDLKDLGIKGKVSVTDLWSDRYLGIAEGSVHAGLAPHASILLKLGRPKKKGIVLDNGLVSMTIDPKDGRLLSFRNLADGKEMLDPLNDNGPIWKAVPQEEKKVPDPCSSSFSAKKISRRECLLKWTDTDGQSVEAKVTLGKNEPLSYWSATVNGLEPGSLKSFQFPIIGGISAMSDEKLAISSWQGALMDISRDDISADKPKHLRWRSPSDITMQLLALYGSEEEMVYMASDDVLSQTKFFDLTLGRTDSEFSMETILPMDYKAESYSPGYNTILGFFKGDWHDAAATYRSWAIEQDWYQNSRVRSGKTPEWARNTALWVWNRGHASNVLTEAEDAKDFMDGLPVSVLWHWWHNSPYDDGFPEYIPPKDGVDSFKTAVSKAAADDIHELVYMNSIQWGSSTESFKTENAEKYCARTEDGGDYSHVFNVFTGHSLTPMCMGTDFWKEKYCSLADSAICGYGVSGIYMDQACMSYDCYNPDHGHPVGPGSYWLEEFHKLTDMIRETSGERGCSPALAGEGSGESWMTSLDLFLTLEASRERYAGVSNTRTIPMFQEVYHDCALSFGSYSSLVYPPYDDLWPEEYRPANAETELPEEFNMQFRLEQARCFVWGTQPMIANYHSFLRQTRPAELEFLKKIVKTRYNAPEYLGCGVYTRFPEISSPSVNLPYSRISIYAGRTGDTVTRGETESPSIYSGGWLSADGNCAVAIVNITDSDLPIRFTFKPSDYGIKGKYNVNIIDSEGRRPFASDVKGAYEVDLSISGRDAYLIEFSK